MTIAIGGFSTDWSVSPVLNVEASRLYGRDIFKKGIKEATFGGTWMQRGAMPLMELNKHEYENHLSFKFRVTKDGSIETMDPEGNWHSPQIWFSQRWMQQDADEMVRRARATGQICIADLDDAFHVLPKTNIASQSTDPKVNPTFNRVHYWKMLAACDAVTVSTEPLKREMERIGVPAFVVRNAIHLDQWIPNDPGNGSIGWIGGIQWRSEDLAQLRCVGLPSFLREYGLPIYHGGDSEVEGVEKLWQQVGVDPKETQCLTAPLCHIAEYPKLWDPVAISLIPLQRCAFNDSKSWLKQLESCAKGVPYIVSAKFPEQQLLIDEGTAGRVARNDKPSQWIDHLTELLDPEVRRLEGKINRAVAERHDIKDRWTDWDEVFRQFV